MGKFFFLGIVVFHSFAFCLSRHDFDVQRLAISKKLPHQRIISIYQDHLGYVWMGTKAGLCRFDGHDLKTFFHNPQDSTSLPHDECKQIFEDNNGRLHICTRGGLSIFDRATQSFTTLNTAPFSRVFRKDSTHVWLTTDGAGLAEYDLNNHSLKFFKHDPNDSTSFLSDFIDVVLMDRDNDVWLGHHSAGVEVRSHGKRINSYDLPSQSSKTTSRYIITAFAQDSSGLIWVGSQFHGLWLIDKEKQTVISPDSLYRLSKPLIQSTISDIHIEAQRVWLGTDTGLYVYEFTQDTCIHLQEQMTLTERQPDSLITRLYRDRQAVLWMGTRDGVSNITERQRFRHYHNFSDGLPNVQNHVWSFLSEGDSVWIGTGMGLIKWQERRNRFTSFPIKQELPAVRSILRADSRHLYVLTLGGHLYTFDCQTETFLSVHKIGDYLNIPVGGYCAVHGQYGALWIGMNGGSLFHVSPQTGEMRNYVYPKHTATHWILDILPDPKNDVLWCGTWEHGLKRFDLESKTFTPHNHALLPHIDQDLPTVLCIERGPTGFLWLGTYSDGLFALQPKTGTIHRWTTTDGLPSNIIYSLIFDTTNKLWLGTNRGVAQLDPETGICRVFDESDGLQGMEFNVGAAARTESGHVLFGGSNGFNLIDPAVHVNPHPPRIVLDDIKIFGESVPPASRERQPGIYRFSHRETVLSFHVSVLHFQNPQKNQLLYRIPRDSEQWINLEQERAIFLPHIKPGTYRLELAAISSDGIRTPNPYTFRIVVTPPLWKTWWFYLGVTLAFILTVWMYFSRRTRRRLHIEHIKEKERDQMRQKLAADFHDEVGHRLTKISPLSEVLRTQYKASHPDIEQRTSRLIQHARQIHADLREFIWELDDEKRSLYDLLVQLKRFGDQLCEDTHLQFELVGIEESFAQQELPPQWREQLMRLFKEAMNNALQHARATQLELQCRLTGDNLMLQMCDNGRGFSPDQVKRQSGLTHMRQRAQHVGGTLLIHSEPQRGTCVTFFGTLP